MAKITGLEQKTFQGKPQGFKVTFDDGRSGNMEEKQSDKGLRVGDTVIVTEIPYTSKAGNKSTLYGARLSQEQGTSQIPSHQQNTPSLAPSNKPSNTIPQNNSIEAQKAHAAVSAMEFIVNAVVEGKLDWPQLAEKQREATQILWNEIDEIYNGKV